MARDPGYFVTFIDKEGKRQKGRTFHREQPVNGKEVWKKRLLAHDRLTVRGMCD